MSIAHFFRILWARRVLVLSALLGSILAGLLIAVILPPRYTATSRLMMDIVKPDPVTGEMLSSQFARAYVATQIEIIKDYKVAGRVVDKEGWTSSPALAAAYRADVGDNGNTSGLRRWLAQRIIDNVEVKLVEGSNILEISYTSDNPAAAAEIADSLRSAYEQETSDLRQQGARANAQWFQLQTQKLRQQLSAAETKLTAFEKENGVVISPDGTTDAQSARLQAMSQVPDMPSPMAMGGSIPITSPSQGQLAQLDASIQTLTATLGPNHPRLQALREQRAALATTVARDLSAARAASRPASGAGPSAGQLMSSQQEKVLAQRGKVDEARQLAVDVMALREQVANSVKRTGDFQQEAQATETGLSFLGNAVPPQSPTSPKVVLIILGSIGLGLALGIGLALLVELLKRRVRGPIDLHFDGVPLLGVAHLNVPTDKPKLSVRRLIPFGRPSAA